MSFWRKAWWNIRFWRRQLPGRVKQLAFMGVVWALWR